MSNSRKYPTIAFGRRKRIDIGMFKGKVYVHLHDMTKNKSVTLDKDELCLFFELKNKINKKVNKMIKLNREEGESEKKKRGSSKKDGHAKARESESSSDAGMGDSSDSDV